MTALVKRNGKRRLNVMFGDFCYYNRHTLVARYTPLGIGMIAQYAKQKYGNDIEVSLYKNVEKFLDKVKENPPDVVGLSVYYWNLNLNQIVVNKLREMLGEQVIIVLGGPCIDTDENEQYRYLTKVFPKVDAIVTNEGELGFSNVIGKALENRKSIFNTQIEGVSFLSENKLVKGLQIGLTLDLTTMGSPYLSGLMDEFMHSDYQPLIQTSRFCPYTCAFCVSGKNRGKLRGYPIEQVEEELRYVSKKYVDRPHHTIYLADENFGILKRDVEVAKIIRKCNEDYNYPQSVFFYNDKRFTETSRSVIEILGHLNQYGMCLALQTEDPNTLKAINRRNVTPEHIDDAMAWARERNITTTTELIFGMPFETKDGFISLLNRSLDRGFDKVVVNNLFIMDGIELNRPETRKKYGIKTKYRLVGTNYGSYDNTFTAEHEEVVVSTNAFSYEEYLELRSLNLMFLGVFTLDFHKWFFQFVRSQNISLSNFFSRFMNPDRKANWPDGYIQFVDDFRAAAEGELFDTREEMVNKAKEIFAANGNDVGNPTRLNGFFSSRLIYLENNWVGKVLMLHLKEIMDGKLSIENEDLAKSMIILGERERVNLRETDEKEPLNISYDVITWKKHKFKKSLSALKMSQKSIKFSVNNNQATVIRSFIKKFSSLPDTEYYFSAQQNIQPVDSLLHHLTYIDNQLRT